MRAVFFCVAMLSVVNGRLAQVTTSASTETVHAGDHITLTLDVDLRPNVHVYAPGAENYIPITWTLDESPAYKTAEVHMPTPRKLYLPVIDETVPVYEGHFRLTRDVTIGPESALHEDRIGIAGTLRYQACDDQMCYKPEKLPLQWTFAVAHK
jgi:DsbC/DsbD-like thiol-disulfide interchange protein